MSLIPKSILQTRWLSALGHIRKGSITYAGPNGDQYHFEAHEAGPQVTFRIRDFGVLERLVARGDIGLGEDYIAGAWDTDDLEALISFFLLNLDELEGFAHGNLINRMAFRALNTLVRRNNETGARRNIEAHYDVGNDFYALWLDETMTYSSALFAGESDKLDEAQRRKYQRILDKVEKNRGSLLEIGCGWGGFAELAAKVGHDVTGLTISPAQHAFATARLEGKADIKLQDYRKVHGTFDSIVSIEMLEAVGERYWPIYFQSIAEHLTQGGRAVVQAILVRDELFSCYRARSDFVRHYVFPGGMLPSFKRIKEEARRAGLKVIDVYRFGQDYARTLRRWSDRMRARESDIYALGYDARFLRNWQFYLGICAAAFAVGRTDVAQVEFAHD